VPVDDLWHLTRAPDGAAPCGEHGQLVASGRHGRGKRYRVRYTDPAGATQTRLFDKKGDAERFDVDQRSKVARGEYIDPASRRITLQEYGEQWRAMQPHRANTARNTGSRLAKHIYPALGARPLTAVRASEVQAFVMGLDLAPASVRPVFETLSAIFGAALRDRLIPFSPCERVKLPERSTGQMVLLTPEQLRALEAALPARYRAVVATGAGAGLRQGELFGLQVRDVDFLRRTIKVERQVQPAEGGGGDVCPPKNKTSARAIPAAQHVLDALAAHLSEYPAGRDDFIFRTGSGLPLTRNTFNAVWGRAIKAAGLPGVTCHDLRHFYASALIRAGLNPKVVAARLGHADVTMTLRVYTHLWPDDEDRSREAIDAVFDTEAPPRLRSVE